MRIHQLRITGHQAPILSHQSHAHRFQDHSLWTLAVPFAVEDPLPWSEVEATLRDGDDHFVAYRQGAEMRGRVVLAGAAIVPVAVGLPGSDVSLEPIEDVLPEIGLVVVHEDGRRDVHG